MVFFARLPPCNLRWLAVDVDICSVFRFKLGRIFGQTFFPMWVQDPTSHYDRGQEESMTRSVISMFTPPKPDSTDARDVFYRRLLAGDGGYRWAREGAGGCAKV